jgi:hypothetical protein
MLILLQAVKAKIYWRGYFWLSLVSPEPLNIPTCPYFWQLLPELSSKSKVCREAASLGSTLQSMQHPTDAANAKRCAYGFYKFDIHGSVHRSMNQ